MRLFPLALPVLFGALAVFSLPADARERRRPRENRAEARPELDANRDGARSQEERSAAREARRAAFVAKFDADGNGELSEAEMATAREARSSRQRQGHRPPPRHHHRRRHNIRRFLGPCVKVEFDADGDGRLNKEELAAARAARKAEHLAEFDADADGELSDEERQTARDTRKAEIEAARAERKVALLADFDANGDGELNEEEHAAIRAARRADLLAKFDTDGDGELSEAERQASRESRCQSDDVQTKALSIVLPSLFVRGDADLSGATDFSDAVVTLSYLFLGAVKPKCMDAADSNDDGSLDFGDPIATLVGLFLTPGLPAPYPDPGVDETLDGLGCNEF